ncbi:serine hydrolase domain-containing protein [Halomicroarcula sp. GCM10025324]|uniref:serine hydrolase domain-containing protein n=1 Tax=Haloarcula TaxID=2237 RepID=UPI0023E82C93|nr:serine hydrolase domain-containing protein [Halomicroarcula sp. ZS-22-S1]
MQHRFVHIIIVVVLIFALVSTPIGTAAAESDRSFGSQADQIDLSDRAETEAWVDETMAHQLEAYHIPGAAVVIVSDGEVVLAKGYGYADLESQRPVDADETVFSVGSTGKLVTWTAVMQGVEEDRLELDDDVNDYLTDSAVTVPDTYAQPVTLEHLGTHSAGFEDSFRGDGHR